MTSNDKIEANRRNSRKSCGPRTAAGRAATSRNAFKHGLAALVHRQALPPAEIEAMARALCGDDQDLGLFAEAIAIAESEMMLRAIRSQKVTAVERLRHRHAAPFSKKSPVYQEMSARVRETRQAERQVKARLPELVAKYKNRIEDRLERKLPASADSYEGLMRWFARDGLGEGDAVAILLDAMTLDESDPTDDATPHQGVRDIAANERDEHEALKAAAPDLVRLERYEHRAWLRKRRAIREFARIKASKDAKGGAAAAVQVM
jgi:hypothetical protein